jgi:hypothetical protein
VGYYSKEKRENRNVGEMKKYKIGMKNGNTMWDINRKTKEIKLVNP